MRLSIINDDSQITYIEQIAPNGEPSSVTAKGETESADFQAALDAATALSSTDISAGQVDWDTIFTTAANTYGVEKELLIAIAKQESNFNPNAVSSSGAVGVMQLMPNTAAGLGVSNSYDAYENVMGGAKYIAQLLTRYNGDKSLALAAYNAGPTRVDEAGGIPDIEQTQNYVKNVLYFYENGVELPASTVTMTDSDVANAYKQMLGQVNVYLQQMISEKS